MSDREFGKLKSKEYYDSKDADNFYTRVWDEEHIHIGIFNNSTEPMKKALIRTINTMAEEAGSINSDTTVLDVGAGNGATARYLASHYKCHVNTLNVSEVQNARSKELNKKENLEKYIDVIEANFEDIPFERDSIDICWSIDAIMHSANREKVMAEMSRVLRRGGDLVFTDPMRTEDCPKEILQPILERIQLSDMATLSFYREMAEKYGMEEVRFQDHTKGFVTTYSRLLDYTVEHEDELSEHISRDFLKKMEKGLQYWIDGGEKGFLQWGIMHFRKK